MVGVDDRLRPGSVDVFRLHDHLQDQVRQDILVRQRGGTVDAGVVDHGTGDGRVVVVLDGRGDRQALLLDQVQLIGILHHVVHGHRGNVHVLIQFDPADLLQDREAARRVAGVVGNRDREALADLVQAGMVHGVDAGGNRGDHADRRQVTVVVRVEVVGVRGMLFHVHLDLAGLQQLIRHQQFGGLHRFKGVSLRFEDRDDRGFKQFGVGSLGLGIFDMGQFFLRDGRGGGQQQDGCEQDGKNLFHGLVPLSFHFILFLLSVVPVK